MNEKANEALWEFSAFPDGFSEMDPEDFSRVKAAIDRANSFKWIEETEDDRIDG